MDIFPFHPLILLSGADTQPKIHWPHSMLIQNLRLACGNATIKLVGSLLHVFATLVYLIKSKPHAFYSSYRMSQSSTQHQPTLSNCHDELMVDSPLLQSFSEDKWMSAPWASLYVHATPFSHCVAEALHPTKLPQHCGEKLEPTSSPMPCPEGLWALRSLPWPFWLWTG